MIIMFIAAYNFFYFFEGLCTSFIYAAIYIFISEIYYILLFFLDEKSTFKMIISQKHINYCGIHTIHNTERGQEYVINAAAPNWKDHPGKSNCIIFQPRWQQR